LRASQSRTHLLIAFFESLFYFFWLEPMPAPETLRELRRGQIVAVARKIVADEGLEALTIGSLEARLAFSRGVITYHFQNKDDIVHAVLESAIEEINAGIDAQLGAQLNAEEKLRTMLKMYVRGFLEHVEATRILLSFWGRISSDKRARKANASLYTAYRSGVAQVLAAGKAADEFAADAAVEAVSASLVGVVIGIAMQSYFEKGSIDPEAAIDEATVAALARLRRQAP
jgi:AcrR family transcriptional regulator